jgi:hypothetical protein
MGFKVASVLRESVMMSSSFECLCESEDRAAAGEASASSFVSLLLTKQLFARSTGTQHPAATAQRIVFGLFFSACSSTRRIQYIFYVLAVLESDSQESFGPHEITRWRGA